MGAKQAAAGQVRLNNALNILGGLHPAHGDWRYGNLGRLIIALGHANNQLDCSSGSHATAVPAATATIEDLAILTVIASLPYNRDLLD